MKRSLFNISMIAASLILQNSYATDYNQISRQIKDSVNVGQLLTEEKAVANIEAYEGANVDELKYYNNEGNMNDDAQSNMVDDQNFDTLLKSSDASSEYDIDLDEDWLQNTFNISSQPFETLDIITSTYSDCVGNQRSCSFYQGLNYESCNANREVKVDSYHKYKCHKDKFQYNINCTESLDLQCTNSFYTLPPITHQGFPSYSFSGTTLSLGINRSSGSCGGTNFEFKFRINDPSEIEALTFNRIDVDDKADLYVNGNLVYRTANTTRCEFYRTTKYYPNIDLKSYLQPGENSIKIKHYIGGSGILASRFTFKYKQCSNYSNNSFVESCSEKKFANDLCTEVNRVCSEKNQVRNIGSGVNEYRSCWKYNIIKTCTPSSYVSYCEEIENNNSCSSLSSTCVDEGANYCNQYQNIHRCTNDDIKVIENQTSYIGFFQDIVTDYINYQDCNALDQNNACEITGETCDNMGLKVIDGLEIDRDCWQYRRSYACADNNLIESDCGELEEKCSFSSAECKETDISGICIEHKRNYECQNDVQILDADSQIVVCNSQVYCDNGNCDAIDYEKNKDLAEATAFTSMLENAAAEFDSDTSMTFAGTSGKCSKDLLSLSDCCSMDGLLEDIVESGFSHMQWASGIGLIKSISGDETFDTGLDLSFCSSSENELFIRRNNNQCVYIGRYCSAEEDITGLCLQEKEAYCCFSSKISKIINEQGRPQIGKGWGTPDNPDCSGLSTNEINSLNLDELDFSSLEAEIQEGAKNNLSNWEDLDGTVSERILEFYQTGGGE